MDKLSKDKGKQSPGNDIADEQSLIINFLREIGGAMAMASKTDSVTSLPWILNSSNERGSSGKATLLLSNMYKLRMAGALGREQPSWLHRSISIVFKTGRWDLKTK